MRKIKNKMDLTGKNSPNCSYQKYFYGFGICYVVGPGRLNTYVNLFGWKVNEAENRISKQSKINNQ